MASKSKVKVPSVSYNRLAHYFRADLRHYAATIGYVTPAQHAPGTPAFLAYRVAFYSAILAEGGSVPPVPFTTVVGDTAPSYTLGAPYLSDAFAVCVALYRAGKRSFPRAL